MHQESLCEGVCTDGLWARGSSQRSSWTSDMKAFERILALSEGKVRVPILRNLSKPS